MTSAFRLHLAACLALILATGVQLVNAEEKDQPEPQTTIRSDWARFNGGNSFSVLPMVELQPGFTQNPHQKFTMSLSGIGREPVTINTIHINDKELPSSNWAVVNMNTLTITPKSPLQEGLNTITLTYEHPIDSKHTQNPIRFPMYVNYQPTVTKVAFNDRHIMEVNGREVFVLGSYRSGQEDKREKALPTAKAAGFNMVHEYDFESYNVIKKWGGMDTYLSRVKKYLRTADKLDLGVFMGMDRTAIKTFDEPTLARVICELSAEPALWMWYIWDEPGPETLAPENASRVHHLIKRLDPHHPTIMLLNHIRPSHIYGSYCDVVWMDEYSFIGSGPSLNSIAPVTGALQALRDIVGDKPMWVVPQIHDNKGMKSLREKVPSMPELTDDNHHPNEAEMRSQTHNGIANGCTGVVYYWLPLHMGYSMKYDTPETWARFSKVVQETRTLEPILLSQDPTAPMHYEGGHDKITTWQRAHKGVQYVALVNTSCYIGTDLSVTPSCGVGDMKVIIGDGTAELDGNTINVSLGKAGVAVLAITPQ